MTEKVIQLIIHNLQAYKVVTSNSEETKKEGISSVNVKEQKKIMKRRRKEKMRRRKKRIQILNFSLTLFWRIPLE